MVTTGSPRPRTADRPRAEDPLALSWVQPEELIGHELRQAREDGRDPGPFRRVWLAAGGGAPGTSGASDGPTAARLRRLATQLLDELALLPSPLAPDEPGELAAIETLCPARAAPGSTHRTPGPPTDLGMRLNAAWLGRAAGCLLGRPVHGLSLSAIRNLAQASHNWPLRSWFSSAGVPTELLDAYPWSRHGSSLAEDIDGVPQDEHLDRPLLGLLLLKRYGKDFRTADLARVWLTHLPAGHTRSAERSAYRNLLLGLEPPDTAAHRNPFREWSGARNRCDVHGWTHPGAPAAAASSAYRDARLTHTANGVYGAMFGAAVLAQAAVPTAQPADVHDCLRTGLAHVPPRSRLAEAIRFGIDAATTSPHSWDRVVDRLHARFGHHHRAHVVPNTALVAAALSHAGGEFAGSICRTVAGGWDTRGNGALVGSITGLLARSPGALPDEWTAPLKNRLATPVAGLDGIGFDALATLTAQEATRP
ncbi:ADP-ribosylglycohydrolase family protein [Streptomyces sp. NPDC006879]|uniref:ADP-ribosylglycohydrolase family protein n=1 Tax=Streptomyces sp. NPDC006879 TaxID=3364767 RepID=UPI0036A664BF